MADSFDRIRRDIIAHPDNTAFLAMGWQPLYTASADARVVVVGQAPGIRAQRSNLPWDDASGQRLMQWLGVTEATFRDERQMAMLPMDFFYPGKGRSGDLPPRKDFAPLWHPRLLALMPRVRLFVLVGRYAQKYYLPKHTGKTLTDTVHGYRAHGPLYFPIVHPSPLNFRWQGKNPWFQEEVVPALQQAVAEALGGDN